MTRGYTGALLNGETGFGAVSHMIATESSSAGRRIQGHGTHVSTGALLSGEVGFVATGHVAARKPFLAGRRGPEPWDTW
jgi:hypothetical protein